jgi:OmpA-OmpF porin, OOP family
MSINFLNYSSIFMHYMFKLFQMFKILKILLIIAFVVNTNISHSKDSIGHALFPTPDGFSVRDSVSPSKFGIFDNNGSRYFCNKEPCTKKFAPSFGADGSINIEGTITTVEYKITEGRVYSSLQIIKSYENTIKELGGKRITDLRDRVANLFVIEKPNSKIYVDIYTSYSDGFKLTIIETGGFVQIVTAGQLSDQIKKQGFANLNVNFDTNKSNIKDGDKAAINEVVTLLKNDTKLKLSVEGHTDNVGSVGANKALSQARSDSLVAYMVASGIPANRLAGKGFGSEVPVANNRTEEGKAKNRRVELVKVN